MVILSPIGCAVVNHTRYSDVSTSKKLHFKRDHSPHVEHPAVLGYFNRKLNASEKLVVIYDDF